MNESSDREPLGRGRFFKAAAAAVTAVAAPTVAPAQPRANRTSVAPRIGRRRSNATPDASDLAYVDFLLNLAYLQAAFYSYATTGSGLPSSSTNGSGYSGTVTGGAAVPFAGTAVVEFVQGFAHDLAGHVATLRTFRAEPIAQTDIAFDVDNVNLFANQGEFVKGMIVFADLITSAFYGAVANVTDANVVAALIGIGATLAYQAGAIRMGVAGDSSLQSFIGSYDSFVTNATGVAEQPIDSSGAIAVSDANSAGFTLTRTPQEVLAVLFGGHGRTSGSFFPSGVNGSIVASA